MTTLLLVGVVAAVPIGLDEVRAAALLNTEALEAELESRRATENVTVARSAVRPKVTLEAGSSATVYGPRRELDLVPDPNASGGFRQQLVNVDESTTTGSFSLQLQVSQLLYDGGRWWNQIAQAGAQEEAAAGQAAEQQLASELEAVRRYYELYRAQKTREVLDALVQRSTIQLERARALFDAGRGAKRDAIDAEVNLGNDRISVLRQGQRVAAAQVDLAVWIARGGAEPLEAKDPGTLDAPLLPAPSLDEALAAARHHRPLLKVVARQLEAARRAVEIASAGYFPRLSVFGTYGRRSPSPEPFFSYPDRQNSVSGGLNLSWELFSGFSTSAQTRSAEHARSSATLSAEQAERELEGEVRRALETLRAQAAIADIALKNRTLAVSGLSLAEERFQAGASSTLEVRDAQLKLAQAELSALESRIDVEIARAALHRVTGGMTEVKP
ncbi:MAG: TolC family protein [Myxococcota bacterium]